jgi:hypothetical protein
VLKKSFKDYSGTKEKAKDTHETILTEFKSSKGLLIELFVSRIRFPALSYALESGIRRDENVDNRIVGQYVM